MRGSGQITKHDIARCVNRAKPGSEDIMNALGNHIAEKSVLLFDGLSSYNHLVEQKSCEKLSLVGHESYNKVYHLNTVNSLHYTPESNSGVAAFLNEFYTFYRFLGGFRNLSNTLSLLVVSSLHDTPGSFRS